MNASRGTRRRVVLAAIGTASHISFKWQQWLPGIVLVAIVGVAYFPALHGGWILDDDVYVTANSHLLNVDGLRHIWLEPGALPDCYALIYSLFWLEFHVWGLAPLGFHVVNLALHAGCVFLLWRL